MDPDENVRRTRAIIAKYFRDEKLTESELDELITLVNGLDEWMCKGSALPVTWKVNR